MKHKKFTMIVALMLVVALAAGLGIWATGEEKLPTVTYYDGNDGNNARFVFTNTGKGSATDLFANFSNCMPGDRHLRQGGHRHQVRRCAQPHPHDRVAGRQGARDQQEREPL